VLADRYDALCGKEFHRGTTLGKYNPRCAWVWVSGLYKAKLWKWRRSGAGWVLCEWKVLYCHSL